MPPVGPLVSAGSASLNGTMVDPDLQRRAAYEQLVAGLAATQQEAQKAYEQQQGTADATMEQYVQEAQKPAYQPLPGAAVIPLAAANFADQLTGNNRASQAAQGEVEMQRADMLRRRSVVLQKLLSQHEQQAKAAERTGQFAESLKSNGKVLSLTKAYEQTIDSLERIEAQKQKTEQRAWDVQMQVQRLDSEEKRARWREAGENLRAGAADIVAKNPWAKVETEAILKEYQATVNPLSDQMTTLSISPDNERTRAQKSAVTKSMDDALSQLRTRLEDVKRRYGPDSTKVAPPGLPPAPVAQRGQAMYLALISQYEINSIPKFNAWLRKPEPGVPGKTHAQALQDAGLLDFVTQRFQETFGKKKPLPRLNLKSLGAPSDQTWAR